MTIVNNTDNVLIIDTSEVFNRYELLCSEEIVFNDNATDITSPYIKWLSDEMNITDDVNVVIHYRDRQKEVIGITDNTTARMIVHAEHSDNIKISDAAHSAVYYAAPQVSDSVVTFTDTCSIKVSRFVDTEFTNALTAGISTSEVVVYTSPVDSKSTILNISLCNMIAGNILSQVLLYKNGAGTPINIRKDLPIGEGVTYVINNTTEEAIQIEAGDEIRVMSSDSNSIDVFLSVIEQI